MILEAYKKNMYDVCTHCFLQNKTFFSQVPTFTNREENHKSNADVRPVNQKTPYFLCLDNAKEYIFPFNNKRMQK